VLTLWVPTAWASRDLPRVVLDPDKPLTSHLNGEEGVYRRALSLYKKREPRNLSVRKNYIKHLPRVRKLWW
jgi:hypothetical protein